MKKKITRIIAAFIALWLTFSLISVALFNIFIFVKLLNGETDQLLKILGL